MAREKKVIDASVLAKCFLKESDSEKALLLIKDHVEKRLVLIVPELVFFEVLNAVRYQLKLSADELAEAARALIQFQLHVELVSDAYVAKISSIGAIHDLTVYDAAYVALGELYGVEVISADKKVVKTGLSCVKEF
mgnify:CR=1 FL=1